MNAEIKKETSDGFGILVVDNNGAEHKIGVCHDGTIDGHVSDFYADAPEVRSGEENEHNDQARRYAKYHVYRERGYDTLDPARNPDRIAATLMALRQCSLDEVEEYFGAFYRQSASHFRADVDRPIDLVDDVSEDDFVLYQQNIYLDADLDAVRGAAEAYHDEALQITEAIGQRLSTTELTQATAGDVAETFGREVTQGDVDVDLPAHGIETVSDVYYSYYEATNQLRTVGGDDGVDRAPDTRLQLPPSAVESIEQFAAALSRHLLCQIRDCYVSMGLEPPEAYRVLGYGTHREAQHYRLLDMYDDYVDPDADIPGYIA